MARDLAKYHAEYVKTHLRQVLIKINKEKEADMIAWLESKDNMQSYIKDLIRKDMTNTDT